MTRRGFTLLEIVIALAILGVSLYALVDTQASSAWMTQDARQMAVANGLAEKAMAEIQLYIEQNGFDEDSVEDAGTFEDFGEDGSWGEGVSFGGEFDAFSYAYVIRKVELSLGDSTEAISEMANTSSSSSSEEGSSASTTGSAMDNVESSSGDLTSLISGDALSEMLDPYVREVRVVVWWGDEPEDYESCANCIQLVTHVVDTSGDLGLSSATGTDSTSGSQSSSGSSGGGGALSGGGGGSSGGSASGASGSSGGQSRGGSGGGSSGGGPSGSTRR